MQITCIETKKKFRWRQQTKEAKLRKTWCEQTKWIKRKSFVQSKTNGKSVRDYAHFSRSSVVSAFMKFMWFWNRKKKVLVWLGIHTKVIFATRNHYIWRAINMERKFLRCLQNIPRFLWLDGKPFLGQISSIAIVRCLIKFTIKYWKIHFSDWLLSRNLSKKDKLAEFPWSCWSHSFSPLQQ